MLQVERPYTWRVFYNQPENNDPTRMRVRALRLAAVNEIGDGACLRIQDPRIYKTKSVLAGMLNDHRLHVTPPRMLINSHPAIRAFTYVDVRYDDPPRPFTVIVRFPRSGANCSVTCKFSVSGNRRSAPKMWSLLIAIFEINIY